MSEWIADTPSNLPGRIMRAAMFRRACAGLTWFCIFLLAILIYHVTKEGLPWLIRPVSDLAPEGRSLMQFLSSPPSRKPEEAGIYSALLGTLWMLGMTALLSIPIGVAAAVYLEEFARKNRFNTFIEINIANLAGVPSIVCGILGLAVFVRFFGFGRSVLAGACTMTILILPVIIIASREAIRAVPQSIRKAALALGATRWQTTFHHVVPSATPGILTGVILALSRAVGETAPLIMIGALTYVRYAPDGPFDAFTVLPIQIFNWASRPQEEFQGLAAAGIIVLLAVLLMMNASAILIRYKTQKRLT